VPRGYRPAGALLPGVLVVADYSLDPRALLGTHFGDLALSHVVAGVFLRHPRRMDRDPLLGDPRAALSALHRVATRWRVDRDRVTLDGFGRGTDIALALAARDPFRWNGLVLRTATVLDGPEGNLAPVPVLLLTPPEAAGAVGAVLDRLDDACPELVTVPSASFPDGYGMEASRIQRWIGALGRRAAADSRRPLEYTAVPDPGFARGGPGFEILASLAPSGEGEEAASLRVAVAWDREENRVTLETEGVRSLRLWLDDERLDLDRPVAMTVNGIDRAPAAVARSLADLAASFARDPALPSTAHLDVEIPGE